MDWVYLFTSLEGRIGRAGYWLGVIPISVIMTVAVLIDAAQGRLSLAGVGPVSGIATLLFIYPSIAIYAKRWHDRDKSGWWTLIAFVPLIGGLWMLVELGFLRGTDGDNRFGPDPLRY